MRNCIDDSAGPDFNGFETRESTVPPLTEQNMDLPVILIVDDEIGVRESLRMVFKDAFRVLDADSLETTISAVRAEKPHIVLLDLLMPRTDGIEVLKQIKSIAPRCEVIMLTALNTERVASEAMSFGAFGFVGKPFDVSELRRTVSQALQRRSNRGTS